MFDIKVVDNEVVLGEAAKRELKKLQEFQITLQEMRNTETELKEALYDAMEAAGIKKLETDFVTITYIAPTISTTIDTRKLKEELPEVADAYSKSSAKKGYVRVEYTE